jgi:hypothetical protein
MTYNTLAVGTRIVIYNSDGTVFGSSVTSKLLNK